MKKLTLTLYIFAIAFILNLIWEHLHSVLYVHYKGEEITDLILTKAALFDAMFTVIVSIPIIFFDFFEKILARIPQSSWICIATTVSVIFAVALEIFALNTGRWAYTDVMPIIPILNVGLTPSIQLGLLFFITHKIVKKLR